MEKIVALCKRRGFIFQSSEIYGGINGFWDYGPLGVELKRNIKDAWWNDMVQHPPVGPDGREISMVGVDCSIIMNPKVWEASGHATGFADPMIDCKTEGCKGRFRADQISESQCPLKPSKCPGKHDKCQLTEARQFNLMFESHAGAIKDDANKVWLRPETAQGIFANFKNVCDSTRVKIPFGIAQVGKAFRNEINPRNYTFRSREFEQMEIEFFCHEKDAMKWWEWWRDVRINWYKSLGLAGENLKPRNQDEKELAHYSKACTDIEYYFPFADEPQELEGVAHRGCFDLTQHQTHSGKDMTYFDDETKERFTPTVIEPSAGADRSTLAFICEAYTVDESRPSPELMKFHPRLAPIKAAVFPLVNKDGLPEIAEPLFREIRKRWPAQYDSKQSIGKRYARMDEAGTPYCFTVDGQTKEDGTVTVRDRDTGRQERIDKSRVVEFLADQLTGASK
ncbi:MAG: glycine--tRNA ligase [Planctomycetia bacterium]|nr:MAG: glycine--tRNA ligase [Planctomycetia bacterium]RIK71085.1 MAG: glycine--tRNA ligase [Planctomycetota bacterium]